MTFLHGPETPIVQTGSRPVRDTEVGIVGLVGSAPKWKVDPTKQSTNEAKLVLNRNQAAELFGENEQGYTIPRALDAIFDQVGPQGGVKVVVVNVFSDEDIATTSVSDAELTFTDDTIQLPYGVTNLVVGDDATPTTEYVLDTDYTFDVATGIITRIDSGAISAGQTVFVDYDYNSGGHYVAVDAASETFPSSGANTDVIQLERGIRDVVVTGTGGSPTYTEDTDYSVDLVAGTIARLSGGSISEGDTVEISYEYADPSLIQTSEIIGTTLQNGDRTGMEAWKDSFNLYGYFPKILIAPGYSPINAITSALDVVANAIDSMVLVDAPLGTSYSDVISGRGPSGTINFNYSSSRIAGCYPHLKVFDSVLNAETTEPFSQRLAGIWANKVVERGFWWSPSNSEIRGITGYNKTLEFIPGDASSEANTLNANGIITYANYFGSGIRSWGNRSFAYPSSTALNNFVNVRFSQIVINERIRLFAMQFIDQPLTNALIDAILESVNAYFRTLKRQNAIVNGTITYDPADNPASELATGQVKFRVDFVPPPPAERITFYSFLNLNLLDELNVGREAVS